MKIQTKNTPTLRFKDDNGQEFPAWKICKLGDITEKYTEKNREGKQYPVCSISNTQGFVSQKEMFKDSRLERLDKSAHKLVKPKQFAYNPARINVGSIAFQDREETVIVSPLYEVIQTNAKVHPLWLRYFFATQAFAYGVWKRGEGSVRICLSYDRFAKIKLHLPSLPEQQKIADFFTSLDKSIAIQKRKVSALANIKKGMLQKIFSQEFRFKDEKGGEFPAWEEKRLGNCISCFSGGTPNNLEKYYNGDIPFIRSAEIHGNKTKLFLTSLGLKNSSSRMVHKGDLLFALYGANSGDSAISLIDGAINQAVLCIRSDNVNAVFLQAWFEHSRAYFINKYLQGGQGNLSATLVKDFMILLPSLPEQQKIAAYFSHLDDLLHIAREKLIRLQECKKGMLQKMFM